MCLENANRFGNAPTSLSPLIFMKRWEVIVDKDKEKRNTILQVALQQQQSAPQRVTESKYIYLVFALKLIFFWFCINASDYAHTSARMLAIS